MYLCDKIFENLLHDKIFFIRSVTFFHILIIDSMRAMRMIACVTLDIQLYDIDCQRNMHDRNPNVAGDMSWGDIWYSSCSTNFQADNKRNFADENYPESFATVTSTLYRMMSMRKRKKRAWSLIRICRTVNSQMRSMTISFSFEHHLCIRSTRNSSSRWMTKNH